MLTYYNLPTFILFFGNFTLYQEKYLEEKSQDGTSKFKKRGTKNLTLLQPLSFFVSPIHVEISKLSFQEMPVHANVTVQKCICVCIFVHTDMCILFEKKETFSASINNIYRDTKKIPIIQTKVFLLQYNSNAYFSVTILTQVKNVYF